MIQSEIKKDDLKEFKEIKRVFSACRDRGWKKHNSER
jgi:hypothetical protein